MVKNLKEEKRKVNQFGRDLNLKIKGKMRNFYETIGSFLEFLFIIFFVIPILIPYFLLKKKIDKKRINYAFGIRDIISQLLHLYCNVTK